MKKVKSSFLVLMVLMLVASSLAGCVQPSGQVSSAVSSSEVSSEAAVSSETEASSETEISESLSSEVELPGDDALFAEDFEAGMDDWTTAEGNWSIVNDGTSVLKQSDRDAWEAIATAGDLGWTDYSVSGKFKLHNGYAGLLGRVDADGNMYLFDVNELGYCIWRKYQEGWSQLTSDNEYPVSVDEWHTFKMTFEGSTITAFIDGEQVGAPVTDNLIGSGKIGIRSSYGTFSIDDIVVE